MTIPVPQLDDRRWADLVAEAKAYLQGKTPAWTDFAPGDPGIVLVELFAHLTDLMIYRLNRVPEKAFVEYLRLIGLTMRPPAAAVVQLRFECDKPASAPIPIPRGVRASVNRVSGGTEPPLFTTDDDAEIDVGQQAVTVLAHNCELIQGELLGKGTGQPGQFVTVARPPIIAPTGNELDLVVGVEARPGELDERAPGRDYEGKPFRLWQEVDSFVGRAQTDTVYVADRLAGRIVFAPGLGRPENEAEAGAPPEAMAAVPAADREIRAWYRRGGGSAGNLPAGTISVLKDTVPGVRTVTNPEAATGGRPAETLEEAMIRGPQELHSVERAVTAQDYEGIALRAGGAVARARAFTKKAVWEHAAPGTVEVLLVPYVDPGELSGGRLTPEILHAHETDTAKAQIYSAIDSRRPLGTTCQVGWASYKTVHVKACVVVRREENLDAVKRRVERRLYETINPLPAPDQHYAGWGWGQPLHASNVFDIVLKEPGVRFLNSVRLIVESAPDQGVLAVAADAFQARTWYAGAGDTVFRSLNNADSWEPVATFADETVRRIESHPELPGHVAVVTKVADGSRLHVSRDTGESWDVPPPRKPEFSVNDVAWSLKGGMPTLLLATDVGLYELALDEDATFVQILVTPQQTQGFYSVAFAVDALGARNVAVATQGGKGVWLSSDGGAPQTFRNIKLTGEDIRVLAIERDGPRRFLWAGAAAAGGDDPGKGAWRWELRGGEDPPEGWVAFGNGWSAGSCWGLAFYDGTVYAATHHGGVLRADARHAGSAWTKSGIHSGLQLRDPDKFLFEQIDAVAAGERGLILAGGAHGVFGSDDGGENYTSRSQREFTETVALPDTWLFVSGEHDITVFSEGVPNQ